jgi:eukaryotic-like serine/threonine-protein kinase
MNKPSPGDLIADKYRLISVLGEGGTSIVFAADNVTTGKQVAIKWVLPELVHDEEVSQRLLREARVTGSIDHPNVVNVFDLGRHEGSLFLVMELLRGHSLAEELELGPQDPYEFVRLMMPVLRGVQAAHSAGVVHRDLKPDNIFLCVDPRGGPREPKVLDFGISKLTSAATLTPGEELTRAGTIFGTPQFMAPEQMRDARNVNERSDIYALGAIFYRAISGAYPYDGETLTELAVRIVEGRAQPLHVRVPRLDRGLSDVIMKALALDPQHRFSTVSDFAQALAPYSRGPLFSQLGSWDLTSSLPRPENAATQDARASTPSPARKRSSPPPPPSVRRDSTLPGPSPLPPVGSTDLRVLRTRDLHADARKLRSQRAERKLVLPPLPPPTPPPLHPDRSSTFMEAPNTEVPSPRRPELRTLVALSIVALVLCMGSLAIHAIASAP